MKKKLYVLKVKENLIPPVEQILSIFGVDAAMPAATPAGNAI
ncbi:hypothetical protein [Tolypothrix sp. FACHB-123]|nr:hypothetical protein [Tolypothrix sp. FACHB-123]